MADCCLIKKVATVEVYENKNEVRAYGFMAGDRNTPVMEVRFKHLWGEENLSKCKLRWIIVDDLGSLLVGEVPIEQDNTASIQLPNELFTGERRMKVQLTVASCDGSRILNLQQFTDLKVINNLASNEVVEPVYQMLINQVYDDTKKYLAELETSYKAKYGSLESVYAKSKASLEEYLITAQNGGNAEFLQGHSPVNFIRSENTINELINSATGKYKIGDIVDLNGYYTAGDGSHHKRKIESIDDGSGVQLANGLWANIVHSGEVNAKWFGLIPSDDTTASFLNRQSDLLNSALNTRSIETIYFSPGWYRFGKPLEFALNRTKELIGIGGKVKTVNLIFHSKVEDEYFLSTSKDSSESTQNFGGLSIKNIRFMADSRVSLTSGIKLHHAPWVNVENVLIEGFGGNGIEIGEIEDSVFDKLSVFQCGRSSLGVGEKGDATNSTHWGVYFRNDITSDSNNMIRFTNCRIERNQSYPYVMSNSKGCLWLNFQNLHSEIGKAGIPTDTENIVFMHAEAGVTTFTDCHIDNFGYTFTMNYGELYAENCRYMSVKSTGANARRFIKINNCSNVKLKLAEAENDVVASSSSIKYLNLVSNSSSKITISSSHIDEVVVRKGFYGTSEGSPYYINFNGCHIKKADFMTDSRYIFASGIIEELKDGSLYGNIQSFVKSYSVASANSRDHFRNLKQKSGNIVQLVNDKIPQYLTVSTLALSDGGVIWNDFTGSSTYAGWVLNKATNKFVGFGSTGTMALDTPYYTLKMQQEGIYDDYVAYRDELHEYENSQTVDDTMLLPVLQEPVIPESVKAFAEKYKLI